MDKKVMEKLNVRPDKRALKVLTVAAILILSSVLMHDGDHIRQAINWGYSIPVSLLVLNLTVYVFPVISIFLIRLERMSATLVTAFAGIFTTAGFLILHLCGSASGLWGVWNYSYFDLIKGVTYNGVFYQGVDIISWIFLFEVPVLCIPSSIVAFMQYKRLLRELKEKSIEN